MRIWRFEIKRQENTKWDYIIPWGLALIEAVALTIIFSHGYDEEVSPFVYQEVFPSPRDWFLYSVEIFYLFSLMTFATLYLERQYRFVVFPLSGIISFLIATKSIHTSMVGGLSYAIGSIIIYTYYKKVENSWKDVGIYWGSFGVFYGLIPFVISMPGYYLSQYTWLFVILYIFAFIPFLTFIIVSQEIVPPAISLKSENTWFVLAVFINAILWFIIFALIGMGIAKFKSRTKALQK